MMSVQDMFSHQGGMFCSTEQDIYTKLSRVKAFIFDWDGVFTEGYQSNGGFSEADAMGVNLLRFSYYIQHNSIPSVAIISGEKNASALHFAEREHLCAIYLNAKNKSIALHHYMTEHNLQPSEIAFFFDDVLDIVVARTCGLRFMVNRKASPLFRQYIIDAAMADYITSQEGGHHAVREICELILGLQKNYDQVIDDRVAYTKTYAHYWRQRNMIATVRHTFSDDGTLT